MKKLFVFVLIVLQIIVFAGCSIPYGNAGKDKTGAVSGNEEEGVTTKGAAEGAVTVANTAEAVSTVAVEEKEVDQTAANPRVGKIPVALYYQDAEGFLIPVTRWIEKQQGIAKAALVGLVDSAITREELQYYGLYPVIPLDTEILGISIKEGIATVDFDKKLLNHADKISEKTMLASVVYTLTGFKTINGVRIRVNGFEQKELKNGTDISGVFSRERVMINSSELPGGADSYKTDIFVLKKANDIYTYIAPVSIMLKGDLESQSSEKLFNLLIKQKADKGIYNEIPQKTRILNAAVKNGILTVDFSKELQEYGGNTKEEAILKQILYTAGQIKDVSKVKILIEGQTAQMPEGTDLSAPLNVPPAINDVIDNK